MINQLRKWHFRIWIVLALLLPLGIWAAWLSIPKSVYSHLLQPEKGQAFPELIGVVAMPCHLIRLRSNVLSSQIQLEWTSECELTVPAALIYQMAASDTSINLQRADLIGRIDSRGTYLFSVKKNLLHSDYRFLVYDIIHHRVIEKIKF